MKRLAAAGLLLALCAASAGCGDSTSRLLPTRYRTIYIDPFVNHIPFEQEPSDRRVGYQANVPRLEEDVTRAVIDQFIFDGNLRITKEKATADLLLEGEIVDFYRDSLRKTDDDTTEEFRLNLGAHVRLQDKGGNVLFDEPRLFGDTTYVAVGGFAVPETTAVQNLVSDFSRRVVERVVENW